MYKSLFIGAVPQSNSGKRTNQHKNTNKLEILSSQRTISQKNHNLTQNVSASNLSVTDTILKPKDCLGT